MEWLNNVFWIPMYPDGTLLCIENGMIIRKSLDAIDNPGQVFQFWSENKSDYETFWKEHNYHSGCDPIEEGYVLVKGIINKAGEIEMV